MSAEEPTSTVAMEKVLATSATVVSPEGTVPQTHDACDEADLATAIAMEQQARSAETTTVPPMSTGKFPRRMDTYTGVDDFSYVPKANRKEYLSAKLFKTEAVMWGMSFEEWRDCPDRNALRKCTTSTPVRLTDLKPLSSKAGSLGSHFSIYTGDITKLQVDAIVNAANDGCLGGGGVDKAIHMGAGVLLRRECSTFPGCESGQARITKGYNLPAKFVIHTVGPKGKNQPKTLTGCYQNSLELAKRHKLRTVAFCSISTGVYGYPENEAAHIAIQTAMDIISSQHDDGDNSSAVDHVVFVCFGAGKEKTYTSVFQKLLKQKMQEAAKPAE